MFKRTIIYIMFCISLLLPGVESNAEEAGSQNTIFEVEGFNKPSGINDSNRNSYAHCENEGVITIQNNDGIHSVYVEFDRIPEEWVLTNPKTGESITCGTNSFLHEFADLELLFENVPTELVMTYAAGTVISDIYVFSKGEIPDWVQIWQPPCEEADLLLISSHSDDEQLFFAGVLPYYAGERELKVQVAYIVQHFEANGSINHQRPHEQLDGLWTVGVRNYPVMTDFPDLYAESKNRETAFKQAEAVFEAAGITYDDFISYITEAIRRFKPLVVVSHDLNGEYGHGTHVLCASALTEAIMCAQDENKYSDSAVKYGTWEVEKLYLHLYEENQIQMNYDVPLEKFDGKTAFEVSQEGFACHKSQHWTWFYKWIYGTEGSPVKKAADIKKYSPCIYGLYYTKAGADIIGGDFFENVMSYDERAAEALKAEEKRRLEEEAKKAADEAEKQKEKEQLEELERLERAALQESMQNIEKENAVKQKNIQDKKMVLVIAVIILIITIVAVILYRKKNGNKKS